MTSSKILIPNGFRGNVHRGTVKIGFAKKLKDGTVAIRIKYFGAGRGARKRGNALEGWGRGDAEKPAR